MPSGSVDGRIIFVSDPAATVSFMASWARIAAAAGYSVHDACSPSTAESPADLALIEGPVPSPVPSARQRFVVDDGSLGPILQGRLQEMSGLAILCADPDRQALLAAQGLAAKALAPAIEAWRWYRPIRPAWPGGRIVVATDVASGLLDGLACLPLQHAWTDAGPNLPPSAQSVVLSAPGQHLFQALVSLATGLPLVIPPGSLPWLGPLAALRVPLDEAPAELHRLASDPTAWFDQVQQGRDALKRLSAPARLRDDLSALFSAV